jgi:hypothetical protein
MKSQRGLENSRPTRYFEIERATDIRTDSGIDMSETLSAKLTRKFFMSLPEGAIIVSNIGEGPGQPTCFEAVSSASERNKQWERFVLLGCNNRQCSIFSTEDEAVEFLGSIKYRGVQQSEPPRRPGPRLKEQTRTTLTKKFFMGLRNGVFIVSTWSVENQPLCAEYVLSPASEREKQWERIVSQGCSNRMCWVFKNEKEASDYLRSLRKNSPPSEPPRGSGPRIKIIK